MRLDISESRPLFGQAATLYGPIVAGVLPRLTAVPYRFWDNDFLLAEVNKGTVDAGEVNSIAATELLLYSHMAAHTSLIRATRWFEATWREYQAGNFLGWAACLRSLLEAVGDTVDSLQSIGADIAENMPLLMRALTGFDKGIIDFELLEDKVIHFSHARKIAKADRPQFPNSHVARQTFEYIGILKTAGLSETAALYAELCEIGHPARESVSWMYEPIIGGFTVNSNRDMIAIKDIVTRYRRDIELIPSLAYNPGLLILRVMVKFCIFPLVPELRGFSFQGAKGWNKIKPVLDGAPPTLRRTPMVDALIAATKVSRETPETN